MKKIKDVTLKDLTYHDDNRGGFTEVFRTEWFPNYDHSKVQLNNSTNVEYVLRGLHYHWKQYDYWYVVQGLLQVALVDLRINSETFLQKDVFFLNPSKGLFIPNGIAHGFLSIQPTELIYTVNNFFDGTDEYGLLWNDEKLAIQWAIENPLVSERDNNNPALEDVLNELK